MSKFSQLFEFLSSPEVMEKISIGLENEEEGIKCTLKLLNTILREYSKDGTNKRVNISALQEDGDDDNEADNDMFDRKPEGQEDGLKDKNTSNDKSGDQSGSNLSKSAIVKENGKEIQFMNTISNILPLIVQLIKDDSNQNFIDTTYKKNMRVFGGMRLEAVEMIRIITCKFCLIVKDDLIKCGVYEVLFDLFEKYPNNSMLHSKIEEIVRFSLKTGGAEIIEEIMYKAQLVRYILELGTTDKKDMTFEVTRNKTSQGFFAFLVNISNDLVKQAKDEQEISNTLESIPEWCRFQEGKLKERNDVLIAPLGGRDPRTRIDSLFDDNDFLGRFKGFKPVPFDSIKNRRKNLKKVEDEVEQETEEEEEEDEDKLDMEDINQYYEDNDEVIELDLGEARKADFSKTAKKDSLGEMMGRYGEKDRYATIDMDEDEVEIRDDEYDDDEEDDGQNNNLEWKIDPVNKETDDEKLIDDHIVDVAMEFIRGKNKNRSHRNSCVQWNKNKREFDPNDELIVESK